MKQRIDKIAVVGGGSAGWLTATYLAKHFQSRQPRSVQVVLIESSDVGTIGVGEATIPSIRKTIDYLGLEERQFMKATSATFKQSIRFDDWLHLPEGNKRSKFYHTFQAPFLVKGDDAAGYWLLSKRQHGLSFVDWTTIQGKICDAGLGPYRIGDQRGRQSLDYAYHFDASQFATLLKGVGISNGVKHRVGHVTEAVLDDSGAIDHLKVKDQNDLSADLFFDCTGFGAFLIEKKLGSEFLSQNNVLFCDRALALQVPYEESNAPVRPFTTSTAKSNGWIWDIGLYNRRGIGHVYSSRHTSEDAAEAILREYVGSKANDKKVRKLDMRVGYREEPWVKNCVSVGLSSGFIEPLESTGIHQVEFALRRFTALFTRRGDYSFVADQFNRQMTEWFELTFDFIKLHYCLSRREDSDFWIENRLPETIPERLQRYLEVWRRRPTVREDLSIRHPTFSTTSYHQVLFGLEHYPDLSGEELRYPARELANMRSTELEKWGRRELERLPSHRDLIRKMYGQAIWGM